MPAEVDHVDGADDLVMGCGALEKRDESRRVVGGADSTTRERTGGRRASEGEDNRGASEEQGVI